MHQVTSFWRWKFTLGNHYLFVYFDLIWFWNIFCAMNESEIDRILSHSETKGIPSLWRPSCVLILPGMDCLNLESILLFETIATIATCVASRVTIMERNLQTWRWHWKELIDFLRMYGLSEWNIFSAKMLIKQKNKYYGIALLDSTKKHKFKTGGQLLVEFLMSQEISWIFAQRSLKCLYDLLDEDLKHVWRRGK